jgi:UPF0059 membrane protein BVU_2631
MPIIDSLLLSIALAMDCFSVSLTCGIVQRRMGRQAVVMALIFGFFQALMPAIGWLAGNTLSPDLATYDHYLASGLLFFIGGKMLWDALHPEHEQSYNFSSLPVLLTLAVCTSIDALAVGLSFIGMGLRTWSSVSSPILIIGLGSVAFSLLGKHLGISVGRRVHWQAEPLGGIILIIIGLKTLFA